MLLDDVKVIVANGSDDCAIMSNINTQDLIPTTSSIKNMSLFQKNHKLFYCLVLAFLNCSQEKI